MSTLRPLPAQDWLDQIFQAKAVMRGGVVRRRISDVEREVGRSVLERAVWQRGFRLIETERDFVIICSGGPIRIVC